MTEPLPLNWDTLNELTAEVIAPTGPGSEDWDARTSHTKRFNEQFIKAFRANDGVIPGELGEVNMLLMTVIGAKSGQPRIIPLSYQIIDDRLCVIASMGGAVRNPPWFFNIVANPEVTVEIGTETYRATAIVTEPDDRTALYAEIVRRFPIFGEYEQRTGREIPVVELKRLPDAA